MSSSIDPKPRRIVFCLSATDHWDRGGGGGCVVDSVLSWSSSSSSGWRDCVGDETDPVVLVLPTYPLDSEDSDSRPLTLTAAEVSLLAFERLMSRPALSGTCTCGRSAANSLRDNASVGWTALEGVCLTRGRIRPRGLCRAPDERRLRGRAQPLPSRLHRPTEEVS